MAAIEFVVPTTELPKLYRQPALARRTGRASAVDMVWHDTAAGALADGGLSLCQAAGAWRLERTQLPAGEPWAPGMPCPSVTEADDLSTIGPLPGPLMPVAAFHGTRRVIPFAGQGGGSMTILDGTLRGMAREVTHCRMTLDGPAAALAVVAGQLARSITLQVPRWPLATEAIAFARGWQPPCAHTGAPEVPPGTDVADAIVMIVGHLAAVILAGVEPAIEGATPEAVHALRVAVRRLRSALYVFRKPAAGPALDALKPQLRDFGAALGKARDWDVFLAGTGPEVAAALPGDARITVMLAAATPQREAAYAALRRYLASRAFNVLTLDLVQFAVLRPWQHDSDGVRALALEADAARFASAVLAKQHKRMLDAGAHIGRLPTAELHALRKRGKQLRYTAEFFTPCFGGRRTRRYIRSVSRLQEALGHVNDGATAAGQTQALGSESNMAFAAGAIQGYVAARSAGARDDVGKSWDKFRHLEPFWE